MKKKNKNRRILYGYHNLRELSERALRNLDGAMDNAHDVAVMRYVLNDIHNKLIHLFLHLAVRHLILLLKVSDHFQCG